MSIPTSVPVHVLTPLIGIGPVKFGETREEIIARFGEPDQPFVDPALNLRSVYYKELGLSNIEFDSDGRCYWIATNPWRCIVTLNGTPLRGAIDTLIGYLNQQGFAVRRGVSADRGSAYCDELGLYMGRDDPDQEDVDTIAAVPGGYWNDK